MLYKINTGLPYMFRVDQQRDGHRILLNQIKHSEDIRPFKSKSD